MEKFSPFVFFPFHPCDPRSPRRSPSSLLDKSVQSTAGRISTANRRTRRRRVIRGQKFCKRAYSEGHERWWIVRLIFCFVLFQERQVGRRLGRPRIDLVVGLHNQMRVAIEHFPELRQIELVPLRTHGCQVFFREAEQPNGRSQPASMFRMSWMFELLLQMHKSAGGLNQAFEILRIFGSRRLLEPDLLENIVRLVVSLLVPAVKECTIIRMVGDGTGGGLSFAAFQRLHELGNSLAFAHEGRNLVAPAMMGKRARFSLREGERLRDRRRSEK